MRFACRLLITHKRALWGLFAFVCWSHRVYFPLGVPSGLQTKRQMQWASRTAALAVQLPCIVPAWAARALLARGSGKLLHRPPSPRLAGPSRVSSFQRTAEKVIFWFPFLLMRTRSKYQVCKREYDFAPRQSARLHVQSFLYRHAGNSPSLSHTQWFRFGIYELKLEIKEE